MVSWVCGVLVVYASELDEITVFSDTSLFGVLRWGLLPAALESYSYLSHA